MMCYGLSIRSSCGSHSSCLLDHSKEQTGHSNKNLEWKIHGSYCSIANPKSSGQEEQELLAHGKAINSGQPNWQ